jgi:hypothetical protein
LSWIGISHCTALKHALLVEENCPIRLNKKCIVNGQTIVEEHFKGSTSCEVLISIITFHCEG